jgi:hypothetical protein
MCKLSLSNTQMGAAAFVDEAAEKARTLVNRETRGPGDLQNAMHRIERKFGVPYATLWALRYRRPKDILVGAYLRVVEAYEAQVEHQRRQLEHERFITQAKGRVAETLVAAADALGREED